MIRIFNKGKVNKDVDIRLLEQGEIIHSENLRFRNIGKDGIVATDYGNMLLSDVASSGMVCNGASYDANQNRIFYWITDSNGLDRVVMYELGTGQTTILLEGDLNLDKDSKILTANEINDLLFWVDSGRNNPRQLDLKREFNTFTEDDISVIKMPPLEEPSIRLIRNHEIDDNELSERIIYFAYRYRYDNNEYSSISFYSKPSFFPEDFNWDIGSLNNSGMVNLYNEIEVFFKTGSNRVIEVDLLYREANSSTVYRLRKFNKEEEGWGDDETKSFKFSNNKAIDVIPQDDVNALYYNVPNRPFTQELIFNRLVYGNYFEGFDLVDHNNDKIFLNYFVESVSENVHNPIPVSSIEDNELVFTPDSLERGSLYSFDFNLTGELFDNAPSVENVEAPNFFDKFYLLLTQDYNSVSELLSSNDFSAFLDRVNSSIEQSVDHIEDSELVFSNDIQGRVSGNDIILSKYDFTISVDMTPYDDDDSDYLSMMILLNYNVSSIDNITNSRMSTMKSNRGYEVAIYYYDKWNRQTSALVGDDNTVFIPHANAIKQNKLKVTVAHNPPKDAVKFKFGVKEGRLPYETIYAYDYYSDDEFRYIRLDSENKDKVKAGDKIIPKIDESGFFNLYKPIDVLDVELQEEDFIKSSTLSLVSDNTIRENKHHLYEYDVELRECSRGVPPSEVIVEPFSERRRIELPTFYEYTQTYGDAYHDEAGGLLGMWRLLIRRYLELYQENTYHIPIPKGTVFELSIVSWKADDGVEDSIVYTAARDYENFLDWANDVNMQLDEHSYFLIGTDYQITDEWVNNNASDIRNTNNSNNQRNKIDRLGNHIDLFAGKIFIRLRGEYEGGGCAINNYGRMRYQFKLERGIKRKQKGLIVFETLPEINNEKIFYETAETFHIVDNLHEGQQVFEATLEHFNAFSFGNGVESWKIRDRFINTDVAGKSINGKFRGVTVLEEEFKELHRESDLIYGGEYNDDMRFNALNAFNPSLGNWKVLDKEKGSVQRLLSRDTNILVFQSEKTGQVMYGKSVLYDQAGLAVIQETNDVLGSYQAFGGEFGISNNPESLASWGGAVYHTDKKRGVVLRLSNSGYDAISNYGMNNYFNRELHKSNGFLYGGFDPENNEYLLSIDGGVWAFNETENSFNTHWQYQPEFMIYANNKLYSWNKGKMYEHGIGKSHNVFYGERKGCRLVFVFNEAAHIDKVFNAISIYGNESWDMELKTNLTSSNITREEFSKKESFYHAFLRRDTEESSRNVFSLGIVEDVLGNIVRVSGGSDLVSVGDDVLNEDGIYVGTIDFKHGNELTLSNIGSISNGMFLIASKSNRIEGSPLRGYHLTVDMSCDQDTPIELFSVESKEIISK